MPIMTIQVGQKVRIRTFRDSVARELQTKTGNVGMVQAPKIVDGGKMGFVVTFDDNTASWFFADELEAVL